MTWFMRQRKDFIRCQLQTFGMIRRNDIAEKFGVTIQVASADIAAFVAEHPDTIDYDRSAKCYTFDGATLIAPAVDAVELAAFGASEHACTLYPGKDQAATEYRDPVTGRTWQLGGDTPEVRERLRGGRDG